MSVKYQGTPVSDGIAIGNVLKLEKPNLTPEDYAVADGQADAEKEEFYKAIKTSKSELEGFIARVDGEKKEILTAHLSILEDPFLESLIMGKIDQGMNVQKALQEATDEISAQFMAIDDEYMRERAADLQDESARIMRHLKGCELIDLSNLEKEVVVIAKDLTPSDTATMDLEKVLGFATDLGGRTSHTAIMARNMGVPAVVGCMDIFDKIEAGASIILDGSSGDIFVDPDTTQTTDYQKKQQAFADHKKQLEGLLCEPAETKDGHRVELACNIGSDKEAVVALEKGAEAIGLFRTEFLYMESSDFPTEEEQFKAYKSVAETMKGHPVIIRTLDIGGDKALSYYTFPEELNPFLGYRAIRLTLDMEDQFKVQLRAILRASAFGKIRIMFPMVISLNEFQKCKSLLQKCMDELRKEGVAFDEKMEIGIMIETPASVWMADVLAKYVDFFSIGTNDLTQYTLAVDRGNEWIQKLYDSFHPAVLRSIQHVIASAHKEGKWVGMCGEFAGEKLATTLLLGMGLDEFSMSASSILEIKSIIHNTTWSEAKAIAQHVTTLETTEQIREYLVSKKSE